MESFFLDKCTWTLTESNGYSVFMDFYGFTSFWTWPRALDNCTAISNFTVEAPHLANIVSFFFFHNFYLWNKCSRAHWIKEVFVSSTTELRHSFTLRQKFILLMKAVFYFMLSCFELLLNQDKIKEDDWQCSNRRVNAENIILCDERLKFDSHKKWGSIVDSRVSRNSSFNN